MPQEVRVSNRATGIGVEGGGRVWGAVEVGGCGMGGV